MSLLLTTCFESVSVQWLENRSKTFEPTYLYTMEKVNFQRNSLFPLVSPELSDELDCTGFGFRSLFCDSFLMSLSTLFVGLFFTT